MSWVDPRLPIEKVIIFGGFSKKTIIKVDHSWSHKCVPIFFNSTPITCLNLTILTHKTTWKLRLPKFIRFKSQVWKCRFKDSSFSLCINCWRQIIKILKLLEIYYFRFEYTYFYIKTQRLNEILWNHESIALLWKKYISCILHKLLKNILIFLDILPWPIQLIQLFIWEDS